MANAVVLDRTTTTGVLKRLEMRGLIERSASSVDRRVQSCRPTEAGRDLLDRMEQAARQAHDATLEPLSGPERDTLVRLMKTITAAHGQRRGGDDVVLRAVVDRPGAA